MKLTTGVIFWAFVIGQLCDLRQLYCPFSPFCPNCTNRVEGRRGDPRQPTQHNAVRTKLMSDKRRLPIPVKMSELTSYSLWQLIFTQLLENHKTTCEVNTGCQNLINPQIALHKQDDSGQILIQSSTSDNHRNFPLWRSFLRR